MDMPNLQVGEKAEGVTKSSGAMAEPMCFLKHPLQSTWTMWYYQTEPKGTWANNQMKVVSFSTIEDFWCVYNTIKAVSELKLGCAYSLFKQDIKPSWADELNKSGGRWTVHLKATQSSAELDRAWLNTMLCIIGEIFENAPFVCGAVIKVRPSGNVISLWTREAEHQVSVLEIGRAFKDYLHIVPNIFIGYQPHSNAMAFKFGIPTSYSHFT